MDTLPGEPLSSVSASHLQLFPSAFARMKTTLGERPYLCDRQPLVDCGSPGIDVLRKLYFSREGITGNWILFERGGKDSQGQEMARRHPPPRGHGRSAKEIPSLINRCD